MKHQDLLDTVSYDRRTGIFTRKKSVGNTKAGAVIGSINKKGYLKARVLGQYVTLHRLAWFYCFEYWPTQLDHINQIKTDNRIENLRECSTQENCLNQTGARVNNKTGYQGVHLIPKTGRYRAMLRGHHLGCFTTPEEAHAAYIQAKQEYLP